MRICVCLLLVLFTSSHSFAADDLILFTGTVVNAVTAEPLVAAHVQILGTSRGTITNTSGRFSLQLKPGKYAIAVSMIGHRSDTLTVVLPPSGDRTIRLEQSDIILPEVVVTSEDPAYEIIRRAIAAKKRWIGELGSYQFDAFTRQTLRRDTSIASITESYTKGYWQQGDTLREIIVQRRQTENVRESFNFASVGGIPNLSDDNVRFAGYTFTGPISPDAFDYYRYKLLRIRTDLGHSLYEIRITPRTKTSPLFDGILHIADSTYALVGVDLEPNEAFQFPFVKDRRLRYKQQFALYSQTYWLPIDIRLSGAGTVGFAGFSLPRIGFDQTSVIYSYAINPQIPDSVFRRPRLVVDSSTTKFDSTFWTENQVLPLNDEEQKAYSGIDSTQTLETMFRPQGIAMNVGMDTKGFGAVMQHVDFAFNRVEGFHLGGKVSLDRVTPWVSINGALAYGFSNKRSTYKLGATTFPWAGQSPGFGGEVYRQMDFRPDRGYFGPLFNSGSALFGKIDYRDYFESEGWRTWISSIPFKNLNTTLSFISENHSSVERRTDFSIFYPSRPFRDNPLVADGRLRSMRLEIQYGEKPILFDVITRNGLDVSIEHSDPSLVSSDFAFTRYELGGTVVIPTMGSGFLFRPSLRLRIGAGTSAGTLPAQRLFDVESASTGLGPFGVMRGMDVKEFQGTTYVAMAAEHNFRSLPFLALDIPFLYENQIDLILYGGMAHVWGRSQSTMVNLQSTIVNLGTEGSYAEVGIGIGKIFEILRADFTWRFTAPAGFRFSLGVAQVM